MAHQSADDALKEDESGAVDDWMGQEIERDTEVAERAVDEAGGDMDEAEKKFDEQAEGEQRHKANFPHPDDDDGGTGPVDP